MTTRQLGAQLADLSRKLVADGLCIGTAGNLSVRDGDDVLVTPSGVDPDALTHEDVVRVDLDGGVLHATRRPSSELPLHRAVYQSTAANAVVHTHSPYATTLSTVVDELPAIHYTITGLGGPVRVAPYTTFGSAQLADQVRTALADRSGVILQNHGTVTYGSSLAAAYERAELLEWLAALYWRARQIGEPRILTHEELEEVRGQGRRLRYGSAGAQ